VAGNLAAVVTLAAVAGLAGPDRAGADDTVSRRPERSSYESRPFFFGPAGGEVDTTGMGRSEFPMASSY